MAEAAGTQQLDAGNDESDESPVWGHLLALDAECCNIELNGASVTVGRGESCDHQLSLDGKRAALVSQQHFRIRRLAASQCGVPANGVDGSVDTNGGSNGHSPANGGEVAKVADAADAEDAEDADDAEDTVFVLEDLSSNGTFVDGTKVGKGSRRVLVTNSEISLLTPDTRCWLFVAANAGGSRRKKFASCIVERYAVAELLGAGGFGEVYRVFAIGTCRQYAMKVISKRALMMHYYRASEVDRAIENQEVNNLVHLHHPHIIKIIEFHNAEVEAYIILEYLSGGDLFDRIEASGGLSEAETKLIGCQLARAVKYLHDNNVIHRDIKPENVLLASKDPNALPLVKLTDFGLSKLLHTGTMLRTVCGTPGFTAPEVEALADVEDPVSYSNKCDVWSLGSVLYYCVYNDNYPSEPATRAFPADKVPVSAAFKSAVTGLLAPEPAARLSVDQLLQHEWFSDSRLQRELEQVEAAASRMEAELETPAAAEDQDGDEAEDEDGDEAEDEEGDEAEDQEGDEAEDEEGDEAEDQDGDEAEDQEGDEAEDQDGDEAEDEEGDEAEDEDGDEAEDEAEKLLTPNGSRKRRHDTLLVDGEWPDSQSRTQRLRQQAAEEAREEPTAKRRRWWCQLL